MKERKESLTLKGEKSPSLRDRVRIVLEGMMEGVPGLVATAVVDVETAEVLAVACRQGGAHDCEMAGMLYTDLVRTQMRIAEGLGEDTITSEILVTTANYHIILRPVDGLMCYHLAMVEARHGVGLARCAMERCEGSLTSVILGVA